MTATLDPPSASARSTAWAGPVSWVWLGLALIWVGLVRAPLILNARVHLDSDLAVDGLTLVDALNGHWRWHYPATPFIGTPPILLSIVQAKVWGATPASLASGGVVAWGLVVLATFLLNRRAFGPQAASWGLIPVAFASTGEIWLAGRVTGGHLLAVAWHAGAFALLWGCLTRGGWRRAWILGLWSGFGLYIDSMFAVTWVALGLASSVAWWGNRAQIGRVFVGLLAFALGAGVGVSPRIIGQRVDPHDAYVGQFSPSFQSEILAKNGKLLARDCLPRLIAGHRLYWPKLQAEPDPSSLAGGFPGITERDSGVPWLALTVSIVAIGGFGRSLIALIRGDSIADRTRSAASRGVRWGLLVSSFGVVGGFLVSPNLANSDNYRYLVFLVVTGSSGFGLWMARLATRGRSGVWKASALALGFAVLMTVDTARWYERFGWVDASFRPSRVEVKDQTLDWLDAHPQISVILGDYWDVYRLSFLTSGRVLPVPFPQYPDRFPEIQRDLPAGQQRAILDRGGDFGPRYRARALARGAAELYRAEGLSIVEWPEGMKP